MLAKEIATGAVVRKGLQACGLWAFLFLCFHGNIASSARAGELDQLFRELLRNPIDIELNLRYAREAEAKGDAGKALAAYERIHDIDPSNREASAALHRIRISLVPTGTNGRIEIGGRHETNVRQLPKSADRPDDIIGFTKVYVRDQRPLFNQRWRSDFFGYADMHDRVSEIDYWFARAHSGPVFDLSGDTKLQVAPGGAVSFLDGEWFYAEPALRLTFENLFGGLLARLDIRGSYREVNSDKGATHGIALDVIGRNINREVLSDSDVVVFQPFFRYRQSDSGTTGFLGLINTFVLGDYIEAGGQLLYFNQLAKDWRVGAKFTGYYRDYEQDIRLGSVGRHDWYFSLGAEVLRTNVLCGGCDFRLDYQYEQNFSNDDSEDFHNHTVSVSAIKRF